MIIDPTILPEFDGWVGLDLETTDLNPRTAKIVAVGIHGNGETYIFHAHLHSKEFFAGLISKLRVVIHNAKFDLEFIYQHYGVFPKEFICTKTLAMLLENGRGVSPALVDCLERYLGVKDHHHSEKKTIRRTFRVGRLTTDQAAYLDADVKYLVNLKDAILAQSAGLEKVIRLEHALLPVVVDMELRGIRFDVNKLNKILAEWEEKKRGLVVLLDKELARLFEQEGIPTMFIGVNYASFVQAAEVFRTVGEKPPNDGEKDTTEYEYLQSYLNEHPKTKLKEYIRLLLEFREVDKVLGLYGEKFTSKLEGTRVHSNFNPLGADSGRFSSSSPNLQNIPAEGTGAVIRECFLAEEDHVLVGCDMDSAEVRLAASLSKDKVLTDAMVLGADMHSRLATVSFSIIFGYEFIVSKSKVPVKVMGIEVVPNDLRTLHKSVVFCKFYKGGPARVYGILSKYINLFYKKGGRKVAARISDALDKELVGLSHWLLEIINKAAKERKLVGQFGRVRHFGDNPFGDAANFPIQNGNAEAIKIAMVNVKKYFDRTGYGRILLTVHDELVCSVRKDKAEEVASEIKRIMESALAWFLSGIPSVASVKIGDKWEK